jgi:hypothetical protein
MMANYQSRIISKIGPKIIAESPTLTAPINTLYCKMKRRNVLLNEIYEKLNTLKC